MRVSFSPSWQRSLTFLHQHARSFRSKFFDRETSRFPNSAWDRYETRNNVEGARRERERLYTRSISNERSREKRFSFSIIREFSREKQRTILLFFSHRGLQDDCYFFFFFFYEIILRENQWYFRIYSAKMGT